MIVAIYARKFERAELPRARGNDDPDLRRTRAPRDQARMKDSAGGVGGAQEGRLRRRWSVLRDMTSRRARCLSNSRASASRIRTSALSRACWLCFHQVLRRLPHGLRHESDFTG